MVESRPLSKRYSALDIQPSGVRSYCLVPGDSPIATARQHGLLALLEPKYPARRLLDLNDGEQLPGSAPDDLGHVRIFMAVRSWLGEKIAKD